VRHRGKREMKQFKKCLMSGVKVTVGALHNGDTRCAMSF
jgi:hypothetical protein